METVPEQTAEFDGQQIAMVQGSQGAHMEHVENDINFIQQASATGEGQTASGAVEYEGDEEDIVCGRFPHLQVCACEINS